MGSQYYFCKCVVHPNGHQVRKVDKVCHNLEVQQLQARQVGP